MTIVELRRDDWPTLEKIRLEALDDAPLAFVTTVDAERAKPLGHWEAQFDRAEWVVVWDEGDIVGIAALVRPDVESPPTCRFVESVWVEPGHRGRGVLRQIMDDLGRRAIADGATELRLWVLDTNESAERAYERLGFELVTGQVQKTEKMRSDGTFVEERLMSKRLP